MTLKNNRAPLLSNIKLYASFHHHMWIQTGVTVQKRLSWVVTSVTLTFDLWPWPFAWTLLWSLVITPENFMMIRWWEHSKKGVTDGRTDGRTENTICRAAWSQLKIIKLRKNSSFNWFTPFHVLIRPDEKWKKISRPLYHVHFTVIHTYSRHNLFYCDDIMMSWHWLTVVFKTHIHFQMHFLEWKYTNFDWNFTEVCSQGSS